MIFRAANRWRVDLGFNIEHVDFGAGLGAALGPASPHSDVLNYAWRDYGNRVGVWRCLELFDPSWRFRIRRGSTTCR